MSDPKLTIGVNAYEANVHKRVGSNQYAYRLLCELELLTRENPVVEWCIYLPEKPKADMPKPRVGFRYIVCPPKKMWTQWRLPLQLYFGGVKLDVFLSLGHYGPRFSPCPTAVCILDLAYLKFPQFFLPKDLYQLREWTRYSVQRAKHVFTISQATKGDIKEHYQRVDEDISIVYPGVDALPVEVSPQDTAVLEKFHLKAKNYIVSVGTIQPRKNMVTAIKAFELLCKDSRIDPECALVFVGKPGWMTKDFEDAIANSPERDHIIVTGYVEESEKQALLAQAGCSFLVGFYEGFGIPVVESLLHGVRPVVANTSSLPEVAGKYAKLVDPYDVTSVMRGFADALTGLPDPMERASMHEWASQFSWVTSAQKMLEILQEKFGKHP